MIRILVIDDHPSVIEGLHRIFETTRDLRVAARAGSSRRALELLRRESFDLVILDLKLPDRDGYDTLKAIKASWPKLPVLIYTRHCQPYDAERALRDGAEGYVVKDDPPDTIITAAHELLAARNFVSPSLVQRVASMHALRGGRPPHETLTDREREVFLLAAEGQPNEEIANRLSLSVKTVYTHKASIMKKVHARSDVDLAHYAMRYRLLD